MSAETGSRGEDNRCRQTQGKGWVEERAKRKGTATEMEASAILTGETRAYGKIEMKSKRDQGKEFKQVQDKQ